MRPHSLPPPPRRSAAAAARSRPRRACGAVALSALLLTSCGGDPSAVAAAAEPKTLRFSSIADQDETLMREKFTRVAAYLSKELRVPVEFVYLTGYEDAVDHFKNGDVHLVWFGGLTGVQARAAVPGARAIAQGVEDPHFRSYFIAHASTGLERSGEFPRGLAGKTFTFGAMSSTSGRLMPEHFIRVHTGESPRDFFAAVHFSGSHDQTAELVESGSFDAGVLNYKIYERRVADGETDPAVCRVIWKTPAYPDYNFTAHPVLETMFGAGFVDRLQRAILDLDDAELLAAFPRRGFVAADDDDFAAIERLARDLDFVR